MGSHALQVRKRKLQRDGEREHDRSGGEPPVPRKALCEHEDDGERDRRAGGGLVEPVEG
jgi:hypothetical protein